MPGAASPEEAVFTGVDDPTASPVAQEFIKKLQDQGLRPTAANMRRLVEANARNISEDPSTTGPDPVSTVRNDRVENSAQPARRAAPRQNPPNVNLGGNPYGDEGPATNPGGPAPFVDPGTGILMTDQGVDPGTAYGPILGSLIVAATRIPGLRNLLPGIGDLSGVKLNPTPNALPAPPPAQLSAPQARLPAPSTPPIVPGQGGIPTMTVTPPATPPATSASPPSVIKMPPPAQGQMISPGMIRGSQTSGAPDPAVLELLKQTLARRSRPSPFNFGNAQP